MRRKPSRSARLISSWLVTWPTSSSPEVRCSVNRGIQPKRGPSGVAAEEESEAEPERRSGAERWTAGGLPKVRGSSKFAENGWGPPTWHCEPHTARWLLAVVMRGATLLVPPNYNKKKEKRKKKERKLFYFFFLI
jgi:hypothetical protein